MSNVDLRIGGRTYTVACAEGDEARVTALGQSIDVKIEGLGIAGQAEGRQLLFAALMLADELDEARKGVVPAPPPTFAAPAPAWAEQLESVADRLEKCAAALESGA